jgi:4,5-dihydroxyphthalate decarboxylase
MTKLSVTLACAAYDRTWPLISGRVPIEGCDVNFVVLPPSEAFVRAYRSQDFDITELSASSHILTTARGDAPYIAIPAFVSRLFRHSSFYIRTDRGIKSAKDLRGKTIGVTEYQMTAGLWARGLLSDDFGVRAQDIHWRRGGMEKPGLAERTPITLTEDIDLQPIPDGKTLSAMLAAGELDAMIAA